MRLIRIVLCILPLFISLFAEDTVRCFPDCTRQVARSGLFKSKATAYAILVGCNYYGFERNPRSDSLRRAVSDVKKMMRVLRDNRYCVDTVLGTAATPAGVRSALSLVMHAAEAGDRVLFYFSGHGMLRDSLEKMLRPEEARYLLGPEEENKSFYLVLRQELRDPVIRDVIALGEIIDSLTSAAPVMQKVIIIDACFSGSGTRQVDAPFRRYHHLLDDNSFSMLMAWNGRIREGIYTKAICKGLRGAADRNHDRKVDFNELARFVDRNVGSGFPRSSERTYRALSSFTGNGTLILTSNR